MRHKTVLYKYYSVSQLTSTIKSTEMSTHSNDYNARYLARREKEERRERRLRSEEEQLRSGKYALLRGSCQFLDFGLNPALTREAETALHGFQENGDSEDVAFWRVMKKFGSSGPGYFGKGGAGRWGSISFGIINKGFEKWVKVEKAVVESGHGSDHGQQVARFIFEKEKWLVDNTAELLKSKGTITLAEFEELQVEVEGVTITHWNMGGDRY